MTASLGFPIFEFAFYEPPLYDMIMTYAVEKRLHYLVKPPIRSIHDIKDIKILREVFMYLYLIDDLSLLSDKLRRVHSILKAIVYDLGTNTISVFRSSEDRNLFMQQVLEQVIEHADKIKRYKKITMEESSEDLAWLFTVQGFFYQYYKGALMIELHSDVLKAYFFKNPYYFDLFENLKLLYKFRRDIMYHISIPTVSKQFVFDYTFKITNFSFYKKAVYTFKKFDGVFEFPRKIEQDSVFKSMRGLDYSNKHHLRLAYNNYLFIREYFSILKVKSTKYFDTVSDIGTFEDFLAFMYTLKEHDSNYAYYANRKAIFDYMDLFINNLPAYDLFSHHYYMFMYDFWKYSLEHTLDFIEFDSLVVNTLSDYVSLFNHYLKYPSDYVDKISLKNCLDYSIVGASSLEEGFINFMKYQNNTIVLNNVDLVEYIDTPQKFVQAYFYLSATGYKTLSNYNAKVFSLMLHCLREFPDYVYAYYLFITLCKNVHFMQTFLHDAFYFQGLSNIAPHYFDIDLNFASNLNNISEVRKTAIAVDTQKILMNLLVLLLWNLYLMILCLIFLTVMLLMIMSKLLNLFI